MLSPFKPDHKADRAVQIHAPAEVVAIHSFEVRRTKLGRLGIAAAALAPTARGFEKLKLLAQAGQRCCCGWRRSQCGRRLGITGARAGARSDTDSSRTGLLIARGLAVRTSLCIANDGCCWLRALGTL